MTSLNDKIRTECLENGLRVEFFDRSTRYYGDFHRVRIEVVCRIELNEKLFSRADDPAELQRRARSRFGDEAIYSRNLEKMGVAGDQLEKVKGDLLAAFMDGTLPYLEKPGFAYRFVCRQLAMTAKVHPFPAGRT